MSNLAQADWHALVTEFRDAAGATAVFQNGHIVLSGQTMRDFCRWLLNTGRATADEVRELRHRVVRVHTKRAL